MWARHLRISEWLPKNCPWNLCGTDSAQPLPKSHRLTQPINELLPVGKPGLVVELGDRAVGVVGVVVILELAVQSLELDTESFMKRAKPVLRNPDEVIGLYWCSALVCLEGILSISTREVFYYPVRVHSNRKLLGSG